MSQGSVDLNSTEAAIRLVSQFESDEALARRLQEGIDSPEPSSSRTVIGSSIQIRSELPPINEGIIDLTNSDDEDEENDTRESTSSTEAGSEPNVESDEAMAWRLMQEEANGFSMSQRRRSERLSQNSNTPGTSGQARSRTIFRWSADQNPRSQYNLQSPPRHQDDLPIDSSDEDMEDNETVFPNENIPLRRTITGANRGSNLMFSFGTSNAGDRTGTTSVSIIRGGPQFMNQGGSASYERFLNLEDHKVGLTKQQINRLPSQSLDQTLAGDTCPVCLEELATNNEVRRLPCLHVLHKECIDPWLKNNKECPICKFDIKSAM